MIVGILASVALVASQDPGAPGEPNRPLWPGAVGRPFQGEWSGMTAEIYNGEWDFVHKTSRVTTYLSRARQEGRTRQNFEVTFAQVSAPNVAGQDMAVLVVNYQCDYRKIAVMKFQQFAGSVASPPTLARPAPRDWAGLGAFEVAAAWLCEDSAPPLDDPLPGLGSLQSDAARRPAS